MKIIFLGTPNFACPILEALNEKYEVVLVVTKPDTLGKKNKLIFSPVKEKALELGLEVFEPHDIKTDYETILSKNADVMITAAYGQFIPKILLNSFKIAINVHGSILPKHRGGAPIQRAIMNGDKTTGITIQKMVPRMDEGEIFAVKEIPILDTDTSDILFDKLSIIGRDLLIENLDDIYNGKIIGIKQDNSAATYSYNLTKEEELIDFNNLSINIFNQVRGLNSNPGAYFKFNNEIFKVYKTRIVEDDSLLKPGTIIDIKNELIIKTKDKAIAILEIKPQGKKILDIKSFLNGQRTFKVFDLI